jgi:hypothetical protein
VTIRRPSDESNWSAGGRIHGGGLVSTTRQAQLDVPCHERIRDLREITLGRQRIRSRFNSLSYFLGSGMESWIYPGQFFRDGPLWTRGPWAPFRVTAPRIHTASSTFSVRAKFLKPSGAPGCGTHAGVYFQHRAAAKPAADGPNRRCIQDNRSLWVGLISVSLLQPPPSSEAQVNLAPGYTGVGGSCSATDPAVPVAYGPRAYSRAPQGSNS